MTGDVISNNEVLVLSDTEGNIFAIPRSTVERYQLSADQKAQVEQQAGDDVAGFQMQSAYMNEMLGGFRQADLLREAKQSRDVQMAKGGPSDRGESSGHSFTSLITGVWRTLSASTSTAPISHQP